MAMNRADARAVLERLFREVFDDEGIVLSDTMTREQLPAWDSLGHIRLIGAIEEGFDLTLTIDEIEEMTTVGRIMEVILKRS